MSLFTSKFKSYPALVWLLGIGSFLNVGGLSFLWPLNSIYIHDVLGRPMTVAGLVLLLHSAGASLGQLAGGTLFDRFGARPVILTGLVVSASLISLPGFIGNWPLYVTVMPLFGFFASLVGPSMYALAAKSWPEGGRRAFNFLYVANNLGVAAGTSIGGIVAQHSFHLAFLSATATFLIFAVFAFLFIREEKFQRPAVAHASSEASSTRELAAAGQPIEAKIPWLPVISLFTGCFVLWIVYVQWQSNIAVYMQSLGFSLASYSILWTLNGFVIFLGQPLLAVLVRYVKKLSGQMFIGTALYLASFGLLLASHQYVFFLAGMIILTFGEMLLWPGFPAAVSQLSPPSRLGFLQGIIGSAATVGRMLGPLCGGLLYDHATFPVLVTVMIALLIIPTLCIALYARMIRNKPLAA